MSTITTFHCKLAQYFFMFYKIHHQQEQSKFGGAEFAAQYQEALLKEIQEKFDYFQKLNDSKIQNLYYQAKEG